MIILTGELEREILNSQTTCALQQNLSQGGKKKGKKCKRENGMRPSGLNSVSQLTVYVSVHTPGSGADLCAVTRMLAGAGPTSMWATLAEALGQVSTPWNTGSDSIFSFNLEMFCNHTSACGPLVPLVLTLAPQLHTNCASHQTKWWRNHEKCLNG